MTTKAEVQNNVMRAALEYSKMRGVQLATGDYMVCGLLAEEIGKDLVTNAEEALKANNLEQRKNNGN